MRVIGRMLPTHPKDLTLLDSLRTIGSGSPVPSTSPRSHRSIPDELAVSLAPRSERSSPPGRPGGQSSLVKRHRQAPPSETRMALSKESAMGDHRRAYLNASQAANAAHPSGRPDPVDSHRTIGSHEASPQAPRAQVSQSAKRQSREVITADQRDRRAPPSETGTVSSNESAMNDQRRACIGAIHRAFEAHAAESPRWNSQRAVWEDEIYRWLQSTYPGGRRATSSDSSVTGISSPNDSGRSDQRRAYIEASHEAKAPLAPCRPDPVVSQHTIGSHDDPPGDHDEPDPQGTEDPVAGFTFGKKVF